MAEHYIIDDKEHVYEAAYEKHHTKKTVTLNGTYNAEDEPGDITGYSEVTVNVEGGGSATLITKNITENGTYNASSDQADGYSSVSVAVPSVQPTLITKNITENGTYAASSDNADGYSSVTVNVPVPSTFEITSDLDEYTMVIDASIESSVSLNGVAIDIEAEEVA